MWFFLIGKKSFINILSIIKCKFRKFYKLIIDIITTVKSWVSKLFCEFDCAALFDIYLRNSEVSYPTVNPVIQRVRRSREISGESW